MIDIKELSLQGVKLISPKIYRDQRGFFFESFPSTLSETLQETFVQDNHSYSKKHVLRGMHFQRGEGQAKLVRVAVGNIYDVFVDLREDSPTYKKWEAVILEDQTFQMLYIPKGFAHGFCVLSPEAHVLYKVSTPYQAEKEIGFHFQDPEIAIKWPITDPILSLRDQQNPSFQEVLANEVMDCRP